MPEISPLIRLFVSSTFADFAFEREVLQRAVFPKLRALCAAQGCRFQPIDLRWGVSEEAGNEKRTLAICFEELARCQRLSPDLNFLILLGDRYGSRFLPERIPTDQVTRLIPHLTPLERSWFDQAYEEDHNALPPEYVLLPGGDATGDVRQKEEPLRAALATAARKAGFSEPELLPFVASATHLEIQRGLLDATCDPAATICAFRSFDPPLTGQQTAQYVEQRADVRAQVELLKAAVERRLGAERIWRYTVPGNHVGSHWDEAARKRDSAPSVPADPELQDAFAQYDALAERLHALLEPRIQEALARRQSAAQTRDPAAEANRQFAEARASVVIGREGALALVANYLAGQTSLPLIVTGASGVGKSTLLALAAADAALSHPNAVVLTRYIGMTPGTSSLADLLSGLRREIAVRFEQPEPEPLGELSQLVADIEHTVSTLEAPAEHPLFLLIDALDQLGPERHRVDWLSSQLAPHVRIIVSITSERTELANLRTLLPPGQVLHLDPLTRAQSEQVLRAWLAEAGRRLMPQQEAAVLGGFASEGSDQGTPLYLRLAFEQARTWKSFEPTASLPQTVPSLLQAYFGTLERPERHGPELVAYALGYLAAARLGLAEDELLDLLPRSEAVREGLLRLGPNTPPIDAQQPLPVVLWARLAADLERYLTEREADGTRLVTFYHRQVREEAERRYLGGSISEERHAELAGYFAEQPYRVIEANMAGAGIWNRRKLVELAYQYAQSGIAAREALKLTLTDGRFLEGNLTVAGLSETLDELSLLPDSEVTVRIAAILRASAIVLATDPSELANQIRGRGGDITWLHDLPERTTPWVHLRSRSLDADRALLHILQGHTAAVICCALSADGRLTLSGSEDKTLRVWDTATGTTLGVLQGHSDSVSACALSADGGQAISASRDGTVRVWDITRGAQRYVMQGRVDGHVTPRLAENDPDFGGHRSDPVACCALSADGRLALSACEDETLRLWDTARGELLRTLEGHTHMVTGCALSADGRLALSTSEDRTVRLWDTESGELLRSWGKPLRGCPLFGCALSGDGRLALVVTATRSLMGELRLLDTESGAVLRALRVDGIIGNCALSVDGRRALSISGGTQGNLSMFLQTLQLWDTASGRPIRAFRHHDGDMKGCALSADGYLAVTASDDMTLRVWDTRESQPQVADSHTGIVFSCALSADGRLRSLCLVGSNLTAVGHDQRSPFADSPWSQGCRIRVCSEL